MKSSVALAQVAHHHSCGDLSVQSYATPMAGHLPVLPPTTIPPAPLQEEDDYQGSAINGAKLIENGEPLLRRWQLDDEFV